MRQSSKRALALSKCYQGIPVSKSAKKPCVSKTRTFPPPKIDVRGSDTRGMESFPKHPHFRTCVEVERIVGLKISQPSSHISPKLKFRAPRWPHNALDLAVHFPGCELLCGIWPRAGRFGRFQYLNPSQTLYIVDACLQISQNPCRDGVGTRYATPCTAHTHE